MTASILYISAQYHGVPLGAAALCTNAQYWGRSAVMADALLNSTRVQRPISTL